MFSLHFIRVVIKYFYFLIYLNFLLLFANNGLFLITFLYRNENLNPNVVTFFQLSLNGLFFILRGRGDVVYFRTGLH